MGQKTNPIGLRVGSIYRRWNNTWYSNNKNLSKHLFFSQYYVNKFLYHFFNYYTYTKKSFVERALLVNTRLIKSNYSLGFLFIFFYKLRTLKKIKKVKKAFKTYKQYKKMLKQNQSAKTNLLNKSKSKTIPSTKTILSTKRSSSKKTIPSTKAIRPTKIMKSTKKYLYEKKSTVAKGYQFRYPYDRYPLGRAPEATEVTFLDDGSDASWYNCDIVDIYSDCDDIFNDNKPILKKIKKPAKKCIETKTVEQTSSILDTDNTSSTINTVIIEKDMDTAVVKDIKKPAKKRIKKVEESISVLNIEDASISTSINPDISTIATNKSMLGTDNEIKKPVKKRVKKIEQKGSILDAEK